MLSNLFSLVNSGIPDSVAGVDRTSHPTLAEHSAAINKMGLLFPPGSNISYSSAAFNLLADLVCAVTGTPLPEYVLNSRAVLELMGSLSNHEFI